MTERQTRPGRRLLTLFMLAVLTLVWVPTALIHTSVAQAASPGAVSAWGVNYYGELGNGTNTNSNTPVHVSNLTGVTAIAGGGYHSLAVKSDGTVWAWGYNGYGQLGNGTNTDSTMPVQVSGLTGVTAIAAGYFGVAPVQWRV